MSRLTLWLHLTIVWFAAHVLALFAPYEAAWELKRYSRYARLLLAVRALKQAPLRGPRGRAGFAARFRPMNCRRCTGAVLRRAFSTGPLSERANAIYAALASPERWVAHILRRLRKRFTKLWRLPAPKRTRARAVTLALPPRAAINSS